MRKKPQNEADKHTNGKRQHYKIAGYWFKVIHGIFNDVLALPNGFWTPFGLLIGVPIAVFYSAPKIAVLCGAAAVIFATLTVVKVAFDRIDLTDHPKLAPPTIDEQIAQAAKLAAASHWLPPELPSNGIYFLKFGGMTEQRSAYQSQQPRAVIFPGGNVVSTYVDDNRVYVTAQTTMLGSASGTIALNNQWPLSLPAGYQVDRFRE
jgi:hypothetical protein